MTDDDLDKLLARARQPDPDPGANLMARVLADAAALQPGPVAKARRALPRNGLLALLGGWPVMGGALAAGIAGLWVGYAPPGVMADWSAALVGDQVVLGLLDAPDAWLLEDGSDG